MSVVAAVRPDNWDFPLFLHVLGAMILVGGLVAGASALGFARGQARLLTLGYWSLLMVALPGWVLMRIGGAWIYSRQGWDEVADELRPRWLDLGLIIGDLGGIVLLVSLVAGGVGLRRLRQGKGSGLLRVTLVLSLVLLAAYVIAAWAMAGKPG
jgi:hypothetical protein